MSPLERLEQLNLKTEGPKGAPAGCSSHSLAGRTVVSDSPSANSSTSKILAKDSQSSTLTLAFKTRISSSNIYSRRQVRWEADLTSGVHTGNEISGCNCEFNATLRRTFFLAKITYMMITILELS